MDKFRTNPTLKLELKLLRFTFQENSISGKLTALRDKMVGARPLNPEDANFLREHFAHNTAMAADFQRLLDLVASFLLKTMESNTGAFAQKSFME